MKEGYAVLVIPDLQVPRHAKAALRAVLRYAADERWDRIVLLGDMMDFAQVSRWVKDQPEELSKSLAGDYKVGNQVLDDIQKAGRAKNKNVRFDITLGNHCIRPELFTKQFPQLRGLIEIEHGLRFKERGIKITRSYPDGDLLQIGKAYFHHGLYVGGSHAKKHVENFGRNIFYGHTHTVQSHTKAMFGKRNVIMAESLGCLCDMDLDYIGKNPKDWVHAFATFHFQKDGSFNHYTTRIFDNSFIAPNKKRYDGKR